MHTTLLLLHSVFRYFVLIFLLIVLVRSFTGWQSKKEFTAMDNKFSLWLFISTHIQFTLGLVLYFTSNLVVFSMAAMKENPVTRYWLVEHIALMIGAVVFITVARSTSKKLTDPAAKHKRLFVFNLIALILILAAIFTFKDRSPFAITM